MSYNPKWKPVEYKILVYPDQIEKMAGILEKPAQVIESEERMQTRGTLVSVSDMCFGDWRCAKPVPGSRVEFARFAGQPLKGEDGLIYRVMNDKDLVAFLE